MLTICENLRAAILYQLLHDSRIIYNLHRFCFEINNAEAIFLIRSILQYQ